MSRPLNIK